MCNQKCWANLILLTRNAVTWINQYACKWSHEYIYFFKEVTFAHFESCGSYFLMKNGPFKRIRGIWYNSTINQFKSMWPNLWYMTTGPPPSTMGSVFWICRTAPWHVHFCVLKWEQIFHEITVSLKFKWGQNVKKKYSSVVVFSLDIYINHDRHYLVMSTPHVPYLDQIHNITDVKMNNEDESFIWIIHFSLTELNVCNGVMWFCLSELDFVSAKPFYFTQPFPLYQCIKQNWLEHLLGGCHCHPDPANKVSSFPSKHD